MWPQATEWMSKPIRDNYNNLTTRLCSVCAGSRFKMDSLNKKVEENPNDNEPSGSSESMILENNAEVNTTSSDVSDVSGKLLIGKCDCSG